MRNLALMTCVLAFLLGPTTLMAQTQAEGREPGVPHFILAGLEAYKNKGPDEAVRVWIKNSPIEGSKEALTQSNNLRQIQDYYGAYRYHDVVAIRTISHNTKAIYLVLNYETGPLFCKFLAFRSEHGWILTNFAFNTKEELVFPSEIGAIERQ